MKGSYFLSSGGIGSHDMVFGYDNFNDKRLANNHQTGSDWSVNGTTSIVQGTTIYPQFLSSQPPDQPSTFINYRPILQISKGTNFRTHALFYNDHWRVNKNVTLNLGARWDRNHGVDSGGQLISKEKAISPRLGIIWDPTGDGGWSVTGSFAKYVAGLNTSGNIGDLGTGAGTAATFQYAYRGPSINADPGGPPITSDVALRQLFDWFNANRAARVGLWSQSTIPVSQRGLSNRLLRRTCVSTPGVSIINSVPAAQCESTESSATIATSTHGALTCQPERSCPRTAPLRPDRG